jgi:fumarylpyruvate hydrolase
VPARRRPPDGLHRPPTAVLLREAGRCGKAFDQSAPVGPIVPAAKAGDAIAAAIALTVDGAVEQSSTTVKLIGNIAETIAHLSSYRRLEPGDLIDTVAPEGVGAVKPGDPREGRVAGVGTLKVRVL